VEGSSSLWSRQTHLKRPSCNKQIDKENDAEWQKLVWSAVVKEQGQESIERVTGNVQQVKLTLQETRAQLTKQRDKENRRNNIVLYKVPESIALRADDRNKAELRLGRCWMITTGWSLTLARWQKCSKSSFHRSLQPRTPEKFFKGPSEKNWSTSKSLLSWSGKKLQGIRADKSPGADYMSPRLLKEIVEEIAHPVAKLFNQSLEKGCVPLDWRTANVTPIFKKGSRNQPVNYRPVSLTSQLLKVMESIIRDAIVEHLDNHSLILDSQHGFRKGRSCMTNLLKFLDKVTAAVDRGEGVDVVFLDLAKRFDKVPHQRLLAKVTGRQLPQTRHRQD